MRYKTIETIPVKRAAKTIEQKQGMCMTAQVREGYLILDIWEDSRHTYRYAMDIKTHEYALKKTESGIWHSQKICNITGEGSYWGGCKWRNGLNISDRDLKLIKDTLKKGYCNGLPAIEQAEEEYCQQKRQRALDSKAERIDRLMKKVHSVPKFSTWILSVLGGDVHYAFWDREEKTYSCTSCGKTASMIKLDTGRDTKIRNNDMVECPLCHAKLQAKKRCSAVEKESQAMLLSPVDETMSVARHFNICVRWRYGARREVGWDEGVRIFLYKNNPKQSFRIYYWQYPKNYVTNFIGLREPWWDTNPANRRMGNEFLYPENIAECLKDTIYEEYTHFFQAAAGREYQTRYNDVMYKMKGCGQQLEYLYKGRYYRLLKEMIDAEWNYGYRLRSGTDIRQFTGIHDMQMLHRLRDKNGGINMMEWLAWTEKTRHKISDKALEFFDRNKIRPSDCGMYRQKMSPDQIMNYLVRQQKEQYPGLSCLRVSEQWSDYLDMCKRLNKDINDPMVYRPKELKRRHDEAVEESNRLRIIESMKRDPAEREQEAQKMREQYPGAEEILKEIREKYEYRTREFLILVPQTLLDIVIEGQALHHCVANTGRYFDRILARETYILFLRKAEDPETPYYTLEVEPNGTIRQHRSYLDEEPNIEYIRGFLKEWQQVIKKRMSKKDHEYAENSRKLREENLKELKENNNTRVLKGLEQDFLEAV